MADDVMIQIKPDAFDSGKPLEEYASNKTNVEVIVGLGKDESRLMYLTKKGGRVNTPASGFSVGINPIVIPGQQFLGLPGVPARSDSLRHNLAVFMDAGILEFSSPPGTVLTTTQMYALTP